MSTDLATVRSDVQIQAALEYVIENPNATANEIAEHLGVSRTTLYRLMASNSWQEAYQTVVKAPMRAAASRLAERLPTVLSQLADDAENAETARDRSYAASVIINFFGVEALELTEQAGIRVQFSPTTINVIQGDISTGRSPNAPVSKEEIIEGVIRRIDD